jgi:hypothetical protein
MDLDCEVIGFQKAKKPSLSPLVMASLALSSISLLSRFIYSSVFGQLAQSKYTRIRSKLSEMSLTMAFTEKIAGIPPGKDRSLF